MEVDQENNHFLEYDNIIHLFISKKFNKCLTSLRSFINKSNCIEVLNLLFYCLVENKEYSEVSNFIKEHPEILERNDNFLLKLIAGLSYYYQCKFEDALVILMENKSSNESENQFYNNFVNKLLIPIRDHLHSAQKSINQNEYEEAIKTYSNLLNLDKDNYLISSFIYTKLGECSQKMKSSQALFYYDKAIEFCNGNIEALNLRCGILMEMKVYHKALKDLERIKNVNPNYLNIDSSIEECKKLKELDDEKFLENDNPFNCNFMREDSIEIKTKIRKVNSEEYQSEEDIDEEVDREFEEIDDHMSEGDY